MKHGLISILIIVALTCATYFFWGYSKKPTLEITTVIQGPAVEAVYATAVVEPVNWSAVAPLKTGQIIEILVEEGDVVEKDTVLARMDTKDLEAQLDETRALVAYHRKAYDRAKELIKTSAISRDRLDERRRNYDQQKSHARMFEEQIRQMELRALQDGVVLWRDIDPGEIKQAGEIVFWVGQPKPLRLNAEVDEEDIPQIQEGQKVLILADAFQDEVMEARVSQITPKGDPVNKSYRVYMDLPEDTKLMIGMTVETNTVIQEYGNALLVPVSAVKDGHVFSILDSNEIRKTPVKIGIVGEEHVQILNGVQINERIILNPPPNLKDGQEIKAAQE